MREDLDPRLVELYDVDNPDGPDHDYFRALARDLRATKILDLGCGTGLLTVSLAEEGRRVVAIDPSAASLAYAMRRPGGDRVSWIQGDSRQIPRDGFDFAVMSGNVAQHIPAGDWERTLTHLAGALRGGGVLAFESRNPAARAWQSWADGEATVRETAHGPLREWLEVSERAVGEVLLVAHNEFLATGEHVVVEQLLAFRSRSEIEEQLDVAGFELRAVWGGWRHEPFTEDSTLMIFEARAR